MASTLALNNQARVATQALDEVRKNVKAFVARTHPAALVAWFLVGAILLLCVGFTGWHNWGLFCRGSNTDFGRIIAVVPPLLLDGSIILLLVLLLTYFRDRLQWWVAVLFNVVLFIIVGVNTSLNFSLNAGEAVGEGMRLYLKWGILGSFLLAFAMWEVIIHLDPRHKRQAEKARLEAEAEQETHEAVLDLLRLQIRREKDEVAYQTALAYKMQAARMKATESERVDDALLDYEEQEAIHRAKEIRGYHPKT